MTTDNQAYQALPACISSVTFCFRPVLSFPDPMILIAIMWSTATTIVLHSAISASAFSFDTPPRDFDGSSTQRRNLLSQAASGAMGTFTASLLSTDPQQQQQYQSCGGGCHCRLYNKIPHITNAANALVEMTPPSPDLVQSYDLPRNSGMDKFFSYSMAVGMDEYEMKARSYKTQLFQTLFDSLVSDRAPEGDDLPVILEVGMGTFPNAQYYADAMNKNGALKGLDIIGVDPNDSMVDYAKQSAEKSGLLSANTSLRNVHGVAEALPFADDSVDAIVGTLTLCSVGNQNQALSEIRRVLKRGGRGKFLFWEHVLSEDDGGLALQQRILSPIQTLVADGCHLNRRTGVNIKNAFGSGQIEMEYLKLDGNSIISPTVFGIATTSR